MVGHRSFPVLALAGALLVSALPARAEERGTLMRDALSGMGLIEKEQAPIDYQERAPLVMPPKLDGRALPAPRARAANPHWPKEPEVAAREREAEERRVPRGNQFGGRYNDNNATLSIDEMRGGRRADANMTTEAERKPGDGARDSWWVNPFDMMRGGEERVEPSLAEPARDVLTDPPNGYRKAPKKVARSANDPVNNASREKEESDPGTYLREQQRR